MPSSCDFMAPRATPRTPHPRSSPQITSSTPITRPIKTPAAVDQGNPPAKVALSTPVNQSTAARSPSPNYFGFSLNPRDTPGPASSAIHHNRAHWSPPTSAVRSIAATSPTAIPLDQHPDYAAFRRQSEENGNRFGLNSSNFHNNDWLPSPRSKGPEDVALKIKGQDPTSTKSIPIPSAASRIPTAPELGRSPKRLLSSDSETFFDQPRRDSPASFTSVPPPPLSLPPNKRRSPDAPSISSLPGDKTSLKSELLNQRSETLPSKRGEDGPTMVAPQHVVNVLESAPEDVLLIDLRVSGHYSRSRIRGALNLCIPTTLLKRSSYNLQRLADGLSDDEQKARLEQWQHCKYIIVYDNNASILKDAGTGVSMLKKFSVEGWEGPQYIIRGGFTEFSKAFPAFVEHPHLTGSSQRSDKAQVKAAPVIGGCEIPASKTAANPFFGNIRQNMDLIGGVGQMPIKFPNSISRRSLPDLPTWLRKACDDEDNGKTVADKFLNIEKREQKRMQQALSGEVVFQSPDGEGLPSAKVQIAGIEKGTKNRYNNIWPYEHSSVKLQGVPRDGCDYVNANYVKAAWSSKRYIATQAPIPATFPDFWNMIWQQDVRVVVMLTAEKEGGQVKAHPYWPDEDNSHMRHGDLHLTFLSEHRASLEPSRIHRHRNNVASKARRQTDFALSSVSNGVEDLGPPLVTPGSADQPYVTVRRFTIAHDAQPFERMRQITQLQYSSWPDFGAPAHPAHLLGLVEQCDTVVRSTLQHHSADSVSGTDSIRRPILVHCSAGCGRTGTFCAVDSVIDLMRKQRKHQQDKDRATASKSRRSSLAAPNTSQGERRQSRQGTPMDWVPSPAATEISNAMDDVLMSPGGTKRLEEKDWIERDDIDLVERTVSDFRRQRLSMVQSLRQFVLCYETVLEWIGEQKPKTA